MLHKSDLLVHEALGHNIKTFVSVSSSCAMCLYVVIFLSGKLITQKGHYAILFVFFRENDATRKVKTRRQESRIISYIVGDL